MDEVEVNLPAKEAAWGNRPGMFHDALVKIVVRNNNVTTRSYHVHLPIAESLLKHKDLTKFKEDAMAGLTVHVDVTGDLPGVESLLSFLYVTSTPTLNQTDVKYLIPSNVVSHLFNLYIAASCFKLEGIQDMVVSSVLNCCVYDLLFSARHVYNSGFLNEKFRGFFKITFVRLVRDVAHGVVQDVEGSEHFEPQGYKDAISSTCAAGGQLAHDIADAIMNDLITDSSKEASLFDKSDASENFDSCCECEGSIRSNKPNVNTRSAMDNKLHDDDDPQLGGWISGLNAAWEETNTDTVPAKQNDISHTNIGSATAKVNNWVTTGNRGHAGNEGGQTTTQSWINRFATANVDIPEPSAAAHHPEEFGARRSGTHNISDAWSVPLLAREVPTAKPLYNYGPRFDPWTAYADVPAHHTGSAAIAVRNSTIHNCTLNFIVGDIIADVVVITTPIGKPLRMSGRCHGLRGTFPASYVSIFAPTD